MNAAAERLKQARNEFVAQWGALGTQWGINRTMAQIHALLMISPQPLTTDEVMEELEISRGNAHSNLKELVAWGLIRVVVKKGERREFFEAEKDVWQIFIIVARERKRREIEPALAILHKCAAERLSRANAPARRLCRVHLEAGGPRVFDETRAGTATGGETAGLILTFQTTF